MLTVKLAYLTEQSWLFTSIGWPLFYKLCHDASCSRPDRSITRATHLSLARCAIKGELHSEIKKALCLGLKVFWCDLSTDVDSEHSVAVSLWTVVLLRVKNRVKTRRRRRINLENTKDNVVGLSCWWPFMNHYSTRYIDIFYTARNPGKSCRVEEKNVPI
jgi:hypothetical protein